MESLGTICSSDSAPFGAHRDKAHLVKLDALLATLEWPLLPEISDVDAATTMA